VKILFLYFEFRKDISDIDLLEIGIASALLEDNGHEVSMLYLKTPPPPDSLAERIQSFPPDMVVAYLAFDQISFMQPVIREVKNLIGDVPVCCLGPLCALAPEEIIASPFVDYIIIGDFEMTLLELLLCIEKGRDLQNIQNTWVKGEEDIIKNTLRPPLGNLDSLPFAERGIYDHDAVVTWRKGGVAFSATRGCPHQCAFCSLAPVSMAYRSKGSYYRMRSPGHVINEINVVSSTTDIKEILFCDQEFPLENDWLREFTARLKDSCPVPFHINASVERLNTPQTIALLANAGCASITLGIETGSESFRKRFADRNLQNSHITTVRNELEKAGIEVTTMNMVGLPLETIELSQQTIEFNKLLKPDNIKARTYYPVPSTNFYQYCKQKHYIRTMELPDKPYKSALNLPFMTDKEIKSVYERLLILDTMRKVSLVPGLDIGYFDFVKSFKKAGVKAESLTEVGLEIVEIDGAPAGAIRQNPGSIMIFECELRASSFLQFYLSLSLSPVGDFMEVPTVKFNIELHQDGNRTLFFQKSIKPESRCIMKWLKCSTPLPEVTEGTGRLVFSVNTEPPGNDAFIKAFWGSPVLGNRVVEKDGSYEIISEAEYRALKRFDENIAEKEEEVSELKRTISRLARENRELAVELDRKKDQVQSLNNMLSDRDARLDELKQKVIELGKIRDQYDQSISGKISKLMRKKK
jgi:radical SAM superfamily enzyme YgiQ (UPF0313 family)